jgi:hypothetical protein
VPDYFEKIKKEANVEIIATGDLPLAPAGKDAKTESKTNSAPAKK